ncbi:hypothetical protein BIW11_06969 [Tropilaelaps mercedesae]|uniref:HAUS augmin-like complex subunit 6 N-terminal domain-containing protein n=1 Tax=Tropilaelaps mercedesae TaxID=418985 RepID=A0A1V9XVZ9_9ACAR|nr:hypothetical protein BIW11_06969 [Tropilaelaps mercedesae]
MTTKSDSNSPDGAATVEEMAEMAFHLLADLGYSTTQHEFNERLFIQPNNEAFISVFQFLLPLLDRREYRDRFKFVLRVDDKRNEAEFRKALCTYLQDLAKRGDLGSDVPPIKMALFTTPGRSTFLHVLLCVIEAVLRRNAMTLGLVVAPTGEAAEALRSGADFYRTQLQADVQVARCGREQMQSQIESLVEELKRTEQAVEKGRSELRRAQQQEKVLESDERNLERFSACITQLRNTSRRLARILHIASVSDQPIDAGQVIELPSQQLIAACPELQQMTIQLDAQMLSGQVDLVLYLRLLSTMLKALRPLYDGILGKLSTGLTIQNLIEEQREFLKRAHNTLSRIDDVIQEKDAEVAKKIRPENSITDAEADENELQALTIPIHPPTVDELINLYQLMHIPDLQRDGDTSTSSDTLVVASASMDPPKAPLRRRKLNMAALGSQKSLMLHSDLSGIVPFERFESTPRLAQLKRDELGQRRRRSIKDIFTSTPILK